MLGFKERFRITALGLGVLALSGLTLGTILEARNATAANTALAPEDVAALARQTIPSLLLPDGRQLTLQTQQLVLTQSTTAARQVVPLPHARVGAAAVALPDGRVLVWGGVDTQGRWMSQGWWFDPATTRVEPASLTGLPLGVGQSLTVLSDGQVLVTGGWDNTDPNKEQASLWDPRADRRTDLTTALGPRFAQSTSLSNDGTVLLWGGTSQDHQPLQGMQRFDPSTATFSASAPPNEDAPSLHVAASLPQTDTADVATDAVVSLRFSATVNPATVSAATTSLIGPAGPVEATIASVQGGRLAFITPKEDLLPGTRYTVAVSDVRTTHDERLPFTSFGFTTASLSGAAAGKAGSSAQATASSASASGTSNAVASAAPMTTLYRATGVDAQGRPVASTACAQPSSGSLRLCRDKSYFQDGAWYPGQDNAGGSDGGHWRVNTPDMLPTERAAIAMQRHAPNSKLQAAVSSAPALRGQIRLVDGHPIARVQVTLGKVTASTDAQGNFILPGVPTGHQSIFVDGTSANDGKHRYGQFETAVTIATNGETTLPYRMYLPRILDRDRIELPSPTMQDMVVTHPDMPGLEVHIPAGTVIRDHAGKVVTELAIVPMPTDRAPYPTPYNFAVYFSLQPGGAAVQNVNASQPQGITLTYPNYGHVPKGQPASFVAYTPSDGWRTYGQGQITSDGTQLKAEAGVHLTALTSGSWVMGTQHPGDPDPSKPGGACCADPVDLLSGTLVENHTDVVINDIIPISVTRQWHAVGNSALDDATILQDTRSFGSWRSNYDMFTNGIWANPGIRLPDGNWLAPFTQIASNPGSDGTWIYSGNVAGYVGATLDAPLGNARCDSLLEGDCYILGLPDGTRYYFDVAYGLYEIRDRYDNRVQIIRNAGLIQQIISPSGRYFSFQYNSDNNVSQVTDNTGRTWAYGYHKTAFPAGAWLLNNGGTNPPSSTMYFLDKVTYPDQTAVNYTYNENFALPATGNSCAAPYPSTLASMTDRNGATVMSNTYCGDKVIKQVMADGGVYQFAYQSGSPAETDVTDPLGHLRKVTFDPASGYPATDTYAAGTPLAETTTYTRDSYGQVQSEIDPLNRTTAFTYDTNGNPLTVTRLAGTPQAALQQYTWTSDSRPLTYTDELGLVGSFSYTNGCLTSVTDALGQATTIQCTPQGQPISITDAMGHSTHLTYSGNDLVGVTDPLGRTTQYAVDALGRVVSVTDPLGNTALMIFDSNDQLVNTADPRGQVTTYTYDHEGHPSTVTLPNQGTITYQYFPGYRLKQRTDALNQSESWTYDVAGAPQTYTDRKGQTATYAPRDALGRFTQLTYADGSTVAANTYDGANRLTQLTDSAYGTVIHNFDSMDRLTSETSPQGTVGYTYYNNGLRKTMSPANQASVNYTYDNDNRLTSLVQGSESVAFGYDVANRRKTMTLPNGIGAVYSYDNANELTGIAYTTAANATVGSLSYTYDNDGQRLSQGGSFASNLLSPVTSASGTFDAGNRQTSFNGQILSYDANGNLTGDGTNTYVWNARDQLIQIKQGSTVVSSFSYDAAGRRTSKTVSGVTTAFLYDGPNGVQETQGGIVNPILTGPGVDERFARNEGTARNYFLADALNSTVALTDANANLIQQYRYDPYGNVSTTGGASSSYQYAGRESDGNGLYYYRARYYSPGMGRFISEDPTGLHGGINTYSYVGANPMNYIDPWGLACPADLKAQARCFDSSNYDPDTDGHATIQGDAGSDEAFMHNKYKINYSTQDEQYAFITKDNNFVKASGSGSEDNRGYSGRFLIDKTITKAICHSHVMTPKFGPEPGHGDDDPLKSGYPNYIVRDRVSGVLEKVDGQYQYRLLSGRFTSNEIDRTQKQLDAYQHP